MRPTDTQARDAVRAALRRGPAGNRELESAAHVSAATAKRILQELRAEIISGGRTRRRRHALKRQVRGSLSTVETFVVDIHGRASPGTNIELVQPGGCLAPLDSGVWPQESGHDGWWDGLPYPLYDMRPQGYLGRMLAHEVAANLDLPVNPDEWSDEEIVWFLAQYGADTPGDLIVGQRAMQLWTRQRAELQLIAERKVRDAYLARAQSVLKVVGAGSSAGGEFPKFTAARSLQRSDTPHVIVKFSGSESTGSARRWADLLVCEHLAMQAIASMQGHRAARSRILQAGGRTFLESERFDRHGDHGRSAVVTLSAVEAALIGAGPKSWPAVLRSDAGAEFFASDVAGRVEELWWFGRFIANTDMHHGNLSLRPHGTSFQLAPAYDMLPMQYAPLRGGDVPEPTYPAQDLPVPPRGREDRWATAVQAALNFWREASKDKRIGEAFRAICANNADSLQRWADTWAASA
jgi:hypothetical protein